MRRVLRFIFDWLFMTDDQYFNKWVLPQRLGPKPRRYVKLYGHETEYEVKR